MKKLQEVSTVGNETISSRNRRLFRKPAHIIVLFALTLTLGLASNALATEAPNPQPIITCAQADNPPSAWEKDGIPRPIVDSAVEGWWKYLGDGRFVTEAGREFFWRDGKFVNPNGTLMEIPASCREHLLSLGVDRQPTAEDVAAQRTALARQQVQDQAANEQAPVPAAAPLHAAAYTDWSGRYLHLGALHRTAYGVTGVQADVSIFNRSYMFAEYYMVGLTSPRADTRVSLQILQEKYPSNFWFPNVHYYLYGDDDPVYDYPEKAFTVGSTAVWKNLKLAYTSAGILRPYMNDEILDWGLDDPWPYGPSSTASKTQYEIGSMSRIYVPHDTANHHDNVKNRGDNYSTWSIQSSLTTVSQRNVIIDYGVTPEVEYPGLYWFDIQRANYDWLARE